MLAELFQTGLQVLQLLGLCSLLYGVFIAIAAVAGGQGPLGLVKAVALMAFGVYLVGLGNDL